MSLTGSARANQGGDGNIREISSSSSHRDSFRSSPDEGGDLPPGSTHRRYFVPFFRYQPNVEERPVAISRPIRPRGVLTRSSVATKLSDRFISSESSE